MSDRENVISGLQYTVGMLLFDPATGYSKDPDDLNAADRITHDACIGAIALLKEQEAMPVRYSVFGRLKYGACPKCGARVDDLEYPKACGFCGQKVKWDG